MQLKFKINLMDDGSVVTRDGEYLGTWELDAEDHPSFTPDGHTEQLLWSPWVGLLCEEIEQWRQQQSRDPETA
ncbi:hypothetical protein CTT39_05315 [Agrobacterium rosae]|nr:hypothetical protein CTT39_05315 [Agrobacterium rosae]